MPILGTIASSTRQGQVSDTGAMFALRNIVLGATGASSITFNNIPTTGYAHLQLRMFLRTTGTVAENMPLTLRMNNSSVSGDYYDLHTVYGTGASGVGAAASGYSGIFLERTATATAATGIFGVVIVDILDYASVNKNKTIRSLGGVDLNGSGNVWLTSGLYLQSATAISSLTILTSDGSGGTSGNWAQNSSFALYGIKGA